MPANSLSPLTTVPLLKSVAVGVFAGELCCQPTAVSVPPSLSK
ncbi:hypothetical protein ACPUVO_02775 [Pseudocolwellia sp. HL-MZ19]